MGRISVCDVKNNISIFLHTYMFNKLRHGGNNWIYMVMRFVVCGMTGTCVCWFRSCLITSFLKLVSMISVVILICSYISGMTTTRVQAGIREEAAAPATGRRRPRGPACSRSRTREASVEEWPQWDKPDCAPVRARRDKSGLSGNGDLANSRQPRQA